MQIVVIKRSNSELQSKLTLNMVENDHLHKMNENFKLSNKLLLNENEKTKMSLKTYKHLLEESEVSNMELKNQIYDFENMLKELNEQQVIVCGQSKFYINVLLKKNSLLTTYYLNKISNFAIYFFE